MLSHGHIVLEILMVKRLLELLIKKNCKKQTKESRDEKVIKKKGD